MNHHFRSYSEHQPAQAQLTDTNQQSFVRLYSDSQQSLDRLFNPVQASIPLRERKLPLSFFNPQHKPDEAPPLNGAPNGNTNHQVTIANQLHSRSMSSDQRPGIQSARPNFHMRTHSTLAPIPTLSTNHSSHQSSHEFLNYTNNDSITDHNMNGWSSSGNSTDDLTSSSGCWANGHQEPSNHSSQQLLMKPQEPAPQVPQAAPQPQHLMHHQQQQHLPTHQPAPMQPIQSTEHQVGYTTCHTGQNQSMHSCASNHVVGNQLHSRSMSFDQRPEPSAQVNQNLHMRTHSTVAPMVAMPRTNHSSHQSSHEFLNYTNVTSQTSNGWSSSGYSTDDLSSTSCWTATQQPQQLNQPPPTVQQHIAPAPQQGMHTNHHYQHHQQTHMQQHSPQATQQLFYNI